MVEVGSVPRRVKEVNEYAKPTVSLTLDGRCALRVQRRSFCLVCAYRPDCYYLARDLAGQSAIPPPVAQSV